MKNMIKAVMALALVAGVSSAYAATCNPATKSGCAPDLTCKSVFAGKIGICSK